MLGVPLTGLHSVSAFMQASSVQPSAISAYPGTRNQEQDTWDQHTLEQAEGLRLHIYIETEMMSVEQITCVTL